jgi:hypothetical protein
MSEPSADVWAEYVKRRDALERWTWRFATLDAPAEIAEATDHREAARTALDTFFRRCIGVRREPDYWVIEELNADGSVNGRDWYETADDALNTWQWALERQGDPAAKKARGPLPVYIDRAPVTSDEDGRAS